MEELTNNYMGEALRCELDLMTEDEFASALDVAPTTIASWRNAGTGPAYVKLGKGVFYRRELVREWIAENVVSGTTDRLPV